MSVCNCRGIY